MMKYGIVIFNLLILLLSCSEKENNSIRDCSNIGINKEYVKSNLDYIYLISDYKDDDPDILKIPIYHLDGKDYIDVCFFEEDDDIYISCEGGVMELDDECIFSTSKEHYYKPDKSDIKTPGNKPTVLPCEDKWFVSDEFEVVVKKGKFYIKKNGKYLPINSSIELKRIPLYIKIDLLITNVSNSNRLIDKYKVLFFLTPYTNLYDLYTNKSISNRNIVYLNSSDLKETTYLEYKGVGTNNIGQFIMPIKNPTLHISFMYKNWIFPKYNTVEILIESLNSNSNLDITILIDEEELIKNTKNINYKIFKNEKRDLCLLRAS